ncbi:hypothetical protein [Methanobacterium sp. ACI-7]|uniref:hypothetical protein n=1 Tax=unclassified Methanobacterium TaxID=2627676 RepID=UPI0039C2EE0E
MEVTTAMVRRCKNVSILIDKKMRERRIEHDKFIIMLDETHHLIISPFIVFRLYYNKN